MSYKFSHLIAVVFLLFFSLSAFSASISVVQNNPEFYVITDDANMTFDANSGGTIREFYDLDATNNTTDLASSANGIWSYVVQLAGTNRRQHEETAAVITVEEASAVRVKLRILGQLANTAGYDYNLLLTIYPHGIMFRRFELQNNTGGSLTVGDFYSGSYEYAQTGYANICDHPSGTCSGSPAADTNTWYGLRKNTGASNTNFYSYLLRDPTGIVHDSILTTGGVGYYDTSAESLSSDGDSFVTYWAAHFHTSHDTIANPDAEDLNASVDIDRYANDFLHPDTLSFAVGSANTSDFDDNASDGFNEAEGTYVMNASSNRVDFNISATDYNRYHPIFKIYNYDSNGMIIRVDDDNAVKDLNYVTDINLDTNTAVVLWLHDIKDKNLRFEIGATLPNAEPHILSIDKGFTNSSDLNVVTDADANCKYDLSDVSYDSMSGTFSNTGATIHSEPLSIPYGHHVYYVRCESSGTAMSGSSAATFDYLPYRLLYGIFSDSASQWASYFQDLGGISMDNAFLFALDNDTALSDQNFSDCLTQADTYYNPGTKITFCGYEWTPTVSATLQHHDVFDTNTLIHAADANTDSQQELYDFIASENAQCIVAHIWDFGNYHESNFTGKECRGVSVTNGSGIVYPGYDYNDFHNVLTNGYRVNAIGEEDEQNTTWDDNAHTGCFVEAVTREGLISAFNNQRCFAMNSTVDVNIFVYDNNNYMGSVLSPGTRDINISVYADKNIALIELFKNGAVNQTKQNCYDTNCFFTASSISAAARDHFTVQVTLSDNNKAFATAFFTNYVPDNNITFIDSFDANQGLKVYRYVDDANLTVDFNVLDLDGNTVEKYLADINFNTSAAEGGTVIVEDLNLTNTVCDDNVFTDTTKCSWDWNISGISDNNYFIVLKITDGFDSNTVYTGTTLGIDNLGSLDLNISNPQIDNNSYKVDANFDINATITCQANSADCGSIDTNIQYCAGTGCSTWLDLNSTSGALILASGTNPDQDSNLTSSETYNADWRIWPTIAGTYEIRLNSIGTNSDSNSTTGTDRTIDVNSSNTSPDVNVSKVEGVFDTTGFPFFSYERDKNLSIDFNVFDADSNGLIVDINYSPSKTQGTGTVIVDDLNLNANPLLCNDLNFQNPTSCTWDWNIFGVSDANYFIIISITDSDLSDFNSSDSNLAVDNTAPSSLSISVSSFSGIGSYTSDTTPPLSISASDANAMAFSCDDSTYTAYLAYATSYSSFDTKTGSGCTNSDGNKTIYARFQDLAGNTSASANTASFVVDTVSPNADSIGITSWSGDNNYTNDSTPTLNISASDSTSEIEDMNFSCDNTTFSTHTAYASTYSSFNVNTGAGCSNSDGNKTVYLLVRDRAYNSSLSANTGSWVLDTTSPSSPQIFVTTWSGDTNGYTSLEKTPLTLSISETNIKDFNLSCDNATFSSHITYASSYTDFNNNSASNGCSNADGNRTVHVLFRDKAHNSSLSANTGTFVLDTNSPTATISIPQDGNTHNFQDVFFSYTGADETAVKSYSVKADSGSYSSNGANTTHTFTSQSNGSHTYYVKATDLAGNDSSEDSVSITIALPSITSSGSNPACSEVGFYCSENQYCPGTLVSAADTSSCCNVQCQTISFSGSGSSSTPKFVLFFDKNIFDFNLLSMPLEEFGLKDFKGKVFDSNSITFNRKLKTELVSGKYKNSFTLSVSNTSNSSISNLFVIEFISKSPEISPYFIESDSDFTVKRTDPAIKFFAGTLLSGETKKIEYYYYSETLFQKKYFDSVEEPIAHSPEIDLCERISCNDSNLCTIDSCIEGKCVYENLEKISCGQGMECIEGKCTEIASPESISLEKTLADYSKNIVSQQNASELENYLQYIVSILLASAALFAVILLVLYFALKKKH